MAQTVPFDFVLEKLSPANPTTRPMFGCFGVYIGEKIVMALRDRTSAPKDNGVWLATSQEHHESLKKKFPSMRSIGVLGKAVTSWQIIPESADDFEQSVIEICELILRNDPRIGSIPKKKKKKT